MSDFYVNNNNYGLILLRNSYEEALEESEELFYKYHEKIGQPIRRTEKTPKSYLLIPRENILSGQIGLYLPSSKQKYLEIPSDAVIGEHLANPLWVNYDFIRGESKVILGALPFEQFGIGIVDPNEIRKNFERNLSPELIRQIRGSTRKYTLEVHSKASEIIQNSLKSHDIKRYLLENINAELFEELVADLLRDQGFDVFLTSRTGDKGKDIWASILHEGRRVMALVECKVRNNRSAIDPAIARAVVGTYFIEKTRGIDVDCALMVTTSENIGPETIEIQQTLREFSVKDCNDVVNWMKGYGAIRDGLWIPDALSRYLF